MKTHRYVIPMLAAGALAACDDSVDEMSMYWPEVDSTPLVGPDWVLLRGETEGQSWWMRPVGSAVDVSVVEHEGTVVVRAVTPAGTAALLTQGPDRLVLLDENGVPEVTAELPAAFTRLSFSDDGRYAVAWIGPGDDAGADSLFFNPNQLALVDLADGGAVTVINVNGPAPRRLTFAPPMTIGDDGVERRLLVVDGGDSIAVIDLEAEGGARQRLVRLSDPAAPSGIGIDSVAFADEDPNDPFDAAIYVADGSSSVWVVSLLPAEDDPSGIQPAINEIAAWNGVVEMVTYRGVDAGRILAIGNGASTVSIIDPRTGTAVALEVRSGASHAITWVDTASGEERPWALLYGRYSNIVYFVDLDAAEAGAPTAVRARTVGGQVESATIRNGGAEAQIVLQYENGGGFGLLDISSQTEVPIPSRIDLDWVAFSGSRLFATATDLDRIAYIDLVTGVPAEVEVNFGVERMDALEGASVLMVTHRDRAGHYSFIDMTEPAGGVFAEVYGVALDGILDR